MSQAWKLRAPPAASISARTAASLSALAADERDRGAERRQLVRGAAADARAAAGDEGDLAREQAGAEDGLVGQSCRAGARRHPVSFGSSPAICGLRRNEHLVAHHKPSDRPTISFMISLEPAQMRCTRALA